MPHGVAGFSGNTPGTNNKSWLMDVEFLAYAVAVATIAFTLELIK
jgi:hypothetical protein